MSEKFPKISIVTACYNQEIYLEESIQSILNQRYPNLEYIIMDGGSTDNTVNIIKKYQHHLSYWTSKKDGGLYFALQTGLQMATGDIMGWLNSDDLLINNSLFTLADIFSNNLMVDWLQGHPCVADQSGKIVYQRPPRSSKYPFFLKEYRKDGIFIQQESTYWRRSLWEKSGAYISTDYRYAGDFELWMRFYKYAIQYTTSALVGAFRVRSDRSQMSLKHYDSYLEECDRIIDKYMKDLKEEDLIMLEKMRKGRKDGKNKSLFGRLSIMPKFANDGNTIEFNFQTHLFTNLTQAEQ